MQAGFAGCDSCNHPKCDDLCRCGCHCPLEHVAGAGMNLKETLAFIRDAQSRKPNPYACPGCNTRLCLDTVGVRPTRCGICNIYFNEKRFRMMSDRYYHNLKTGKCDHPWPRNKFCLPPRCVHKTDGGVIYSYSKGLSYGIFEIRQGNRVTVQSGNHKGYEGIAEYSNAAGTWIQVYLYGGATLKFKPEDLVVTPDNDHAENKEEEETKKKEPFSFSDCHDCASLNKQYAEMCMEVEKLKQQLAAREKEVNTLTNVVNQMETAAAARPPNLLEIIKKSEQDAAERGKKRK